MVELGSAPAGKVKMRGVWPLALDNQVNVSPKADDAGSGGTEFTITSDAKKATLATAEMEGVFADMAAACGNC
jgi:hypothetical protein